MKVDVKLNLRKIKGLSNNQIKAGMMTAEQMITEIVREQRIPFDEGTLQNVQTFVDNTKAHKGNIKIMHDTPYATRLYFNPQYNFDQTINRNAGGEWWENWLVGKQKDRPAQLFSQFYQRLLRGM